MACFSGLIRVLLYSEKNKMRQHMVVIGFATVFIIQIRVQTSNLPSKLELTFRRGGKNVVNSPRNLNAVGFVFVVL